MHLAPRTSHLVATFILLLFSFFSCENEEVVEVSPEIFFGDKVYNTADQWFNNFEVPQKKIPKIAGLTPAINLSHTYSFDENEGRLVLMPYFEGGSLSRIVFLEIDDLQSSSTGIYSLSIDDIQTVLSNDPSSVSGLDAIAVSYLSVLQYYTTGFPSSDVDAFLKSYYQEGVNSFMTSKCGRIIITEVAVEETVDDVIIAVHLIQVHTVITCGGGAGGGGGAGSSGGIGGTGSGGGGGVGTIVGGNGNGIDPVVTTIDDSIIDNIGEYPCAHSVLQDFAANSFESNFLSTIQSIFGTNGFVSLEFTTDPSGHISSTSPDHLSGSTTTLTNWGNDASEDFFRQSVYINPAGFCTEDGILATMVHESIHAYINYHIALARYGRLGYTYADLYNDFPFLDPSDPEGNSSHHTEILNNYVSVIAGILRDHNPALSEDTARDLALAGLVDADNSHFRSIVGDSVDEARIRRVNGAASCNRHPNDSNIYNFIECE